MLRDESDRMVGAARGEVVQLPLREQLSDMEKAWVHALERDTHLGISRFGEFPPGSVPNLVLEAVSRDRASGVMSEAEIGVLITWGTKARRPPPDCAVARELWQSAMRKLEASVPCFIAEVA